MGDIALPFLASPAISAVASETSAAAGSSSAWVGSTGSPGAATSEGHVLKSEVLNSGGLLEAHRFHQHPMTTDELAIPTGMTPPGQSITRIPFLRYMELNTTPALVVHDLIQCLVQRLDHRLQTWFMNLTRNREDDEVLSAFQQYLGDPDAAWSDITYRQLVMKLGEKSGRTPAQQVCVFIKEHDIHVGEQLGAVAEQPRAAAEAEHPFTQSTYLFLQLLYSHAVIETEGQRDIDQKFVNALLLVVEIGVICDQLESQDEQVLHPCGLRSDIVHFLTSVESQVASMERHAGAHFVSILLQKDFSWELRTFSRNGIEKDQVSSLFGRDGKRKPRDSGRVLRYEPVLAEIRGSYAAGLKVADVDRRLDILRNISAVGKESLDSYVFPAQPGKLLEVSSRFWIQVLSTRRNKLDEEIRKQASEQRRKLTQEITDVMGVPEMDRRKKLKF